ncbi:hypothetical protein PMAYCL1PPCAC_20218, partial [Pristionchus mayeri]
MWSAVFIAVLLTISIDQTIGAPSMPTCPCMRTSQSTCQQFDRRYQAHTIEDAIDSFDDLTLDSASPWKQDENCETEECKNCDMLLRNRLEQVGLLEPVALNGYFPPDLTNKTCSRYRFSTPEDTARKYLKEFYYVLRHEMLRYPQGSFDVGILTPFVLFELRMMKIHKIMDDMDRDIRMRNKALESAKLKKQKDNNQRAMKMMSPPVFDAPPTTDNSLLGYRVPVECYKKGMPKDASGRVSLCTVCWTWRVLPDNYVPRYMNEALCDEDTSCLSG